MMKNNVDFEGRIFLMEAMTCETRDGHTHVRIGDKLWTAPVSEYATGRRLGSLKPPEMRKDFDISEVHEVYHEVARRLVLGQKVKAIAKDLNISEGTVRNAKKSPVIQEQMKIMGGARDYETKNVAKQIRELAPKCVEVLTEILDDDEVSKGLKLKTSLAVLDRAGHSVPKNVNVKGIHAVITPSDLAKIKERAAEIGIESSEEIIDV